jgi:hypothetical protein
LHLWGCPWASCPASRQLLPRHFPSDTCAHIHQVRKCCSTPAWWIPVRLFNFHFDANPVPAQTLHFKESGYEFLKRTDLWISNGSRVSFPTTPLWASMVSLRGPAILFDLDPLWSGSGFGFTADPDPAIHFKGSESGIFIRPDLRILARLSFHSSTLMRIPLPKNYANLCESEWT